MEPLVEYFDGWYADMVGSPVKDEIQQRHLGLPPELLSTSLLGWDGIAEVTAELRLSPGGTLVDLACGRGGYGLEIAARTGGRRPGRDRAGYRCGRRRAVRRRDPVRPGARRWPPPDEPAPRPSGPGTRRS